MIRKPKLFRKYKKYYSCNHPNHNGHLTIETAQKCIDTYVTTSPYLERMAVVKKRNISMVIYILNGDTFASQAKKHNISGSRVRQIFNKFIRCCVIVAVKNEKPYPEERNDITEIRNHSKEWLALLAKL